MRTSRRCGYFRRAPDLVARRVRKRAADLVDLDAEEVAESVREERGGDAAFDERIRVTGDDTPVGQQSRDRAVCESRAAPRTLARTHLGGHSLLGRVEVGDHRGEPGIVGPCARDVAGVAIRGARRVDQQAVRRVVVAFVVDVVQYRAVAILAMIAGYGSSSAVWRHAPRNASQMSYSLAPSRYAASAARWAGTAMRVAQRMHSTSYSVLNGRK